MTSSFISRSALARVLQNLLTAELKAARGGVLRGDESGHLQSLAWSEDFDITEIGSDSLGCDSLEVLRLAAAANEMFHPSSANLDIGMLAAKKFGEWLDIIEGGWRAGMSQITFQTSGSTGMPKRCTHNFSHLQTEVRHLAEVFKGRKRIVGMAVPHHIYGFLFTAMLPDRLGLEVVSNHLTDSAGDEVSLTSGDLVVAIPEQWHFLNRVVQEWPPHVEGVVSTAACPRELIQSLVGKGLQGMTEIYGSTETSGIGTRPWPHDTYRLMPHWRRETANKLLEASLVHDSGMRVRPMDQLDYGEDGSFHLAGRLDGAVQVGGTNVYPGRIAAALVSRPGVVDAAVRLMRPEEGARLKAFIVPEPELPENSMRRQLEVWIDTHLTTVERPKTLTFGPVMPTASLGRIVDW